MVASSGWEQINRRWRRYTMGTSGDGATPTPCRATRWAETRTTSRLERAAAGALPIGDDGGAMTIESRMRVAAIVSLLLSMFCCWWGEHQHRAVEEQRTRRANREHLTADGRGANERRLGIEAERRIIKASCMIRLGIMSVHFDRLNALNRLL